MTDLGWGRKRLIQSIVKTQWGINKPESMRFSYNELLFIIQELLNEEGKPYQEGEGGVGRGYHIFRAFVQHLLYRNLANYDSMILITADKGVGKSSAAIALSREWCRNLGIRFDPKRHIAYSNADVTNKIDLLNKFEPLIADESIRFASAADWALKANRTLKKKLAQVRTKHLLYILCFPLKVYKVEKVYLESFANYWCISRDTKIITRDIKGMIRYTPINKLYKYNPEVLTYNLETKQYEFKTYDKKIRTKKNAEVFEVELVNGLKVKATEEHLFLTQRGYVKLKDLTENDEIEVKTKKCEGCGNEFVPKKQAMIWCTSKCKSKSKVTSSLFDDRVSNSRTC